MSRVLPILFNTEMVQAILEGRKTVTRRVVRYKHDNTEMKMRTDKYGTRLIEIQKNIEGETHGKHPDGSSWQKLLPYIEKSPPCKTGDTLYVRETWNLAYEMDGNDQIIEGTGRYVYYADDPMPFTHWVDAGTGEHKDFMPWRPSIHMPKDAARIWLKVTNVRAERLQDIDDDGARAEGVNWKNGKNIGWKEKMQRTAVERFAEIWDSTIKRSDIERYGWDANPWVWIIEFERCEKPSQCILEGMEPVEDKIPCIGYGRAENDDEPCEMCKKCLICSDYEEE